MERSSRVPSRIEISPVSEPVSRVTVIQGTAPAMAPSSPKPSAACVPDPSWRCHPRVEGANGDRVVDLVVLAADPLRAAGQRADLLGADKLGRLEVHLR